MLVSQLEKPVMLLFSIPELWRIADIAVIAGIARDREETPTSRCGC
jgi:hypothetical protein